MWTPALGWCEDARRLTLEGGFHEGLATSAGRRGMISLKICLARHNTEHENEVASSSQIVTMSGADCLIGGGVVGFIASSEDLVSEGDGRSPYT